MSTINKHDGPAVEAFLHPSFVGKDKSGKVLNRDWMMNVYYRAFDRDPSMRVSLKIEKLAIKGDAAQLRTQVTTHYTDANGHPKQLSGRYQETWKKSGGKWLFTRYQEL
ncbi:MAG: nuclear transport factor 2 family protein [Armatimonadota bacterium]